MHAHASLLAICLLVAAAAAAARRCAVTPDEMLKDPALEARARALSQELRCMVCQNQSIDDFGSAAGARICASWCANG